MLFQVSNRGSGTRLRALRLNIIAQPHNHNRNRNHKYEYHSTFVLTQSIASLPPPPLLLPPTPFKHTEHHSFSVVLSDYYWLAYINIKHFCEVAVLGLSLVISTSIKTYDASIPSLRRQGLSGNGSGNGGGSSSMTVQMGRYGSVGTKEETHAYAPVAARDDVA